MFFFPLNHSYHPSCDWCFIPCHFFSFSSLRSNLNLKWSEHGLDLILAKAPELFRHNLILTSKIKVWIFPRRLCCCLFELMFLSRGAWNCAPSGDHPLGPSWLHAWHSYNPTLCQSEAWELYLFHIIIAPMAVGRPANTPAFRRLHHARILHMCSAAPAGHYYRGRGWCRQPVCFCLAACLSESLPVYASGLSVRSAHCVCLSAA